MYSIVVCGCGDKIYSNRLLGRDRERETEGLPYSLIDVWVREGKYSSREREKEIFTHLVR